MTTGSAERGAALSARLPTRRVLGVTALLAALAALLWLAGWDEALLRAAQALQERPSPDTWFLITSLGEGAVLAALLLPLALARSDLLPALLPVALVTFVLTHALKQGFSLPRPAAVLDDLQVIGPVLRRRSFPSGHSACVTSLCVLLASVLGRRRGLPLLAFAALVCCSRVVVAAHWPRDVLAGAAVGLSGTGLGLRWHDHWRWLHSAAGRHTTAVLQALAGLSVLLDGPVSDELHPWAWWLVLAALVLAAWQVARGSPALAPPTALADQDRGPA